MVLNKFEFSKRKKKYFWKNPKLRICSFLKLLFFQETSKLVFLYSKFRMKVEMRNTVEWFFAKILFSCLLENSSIEKIFKVGSQRENFENSRVSDSRTSILCSRDQQEEEEICLMRWIIHKILRRNFSRTFWKKFEEFVWR